MTTWIENAYKGYRDGDDTLYCGQLWSGRYAVWARGVDGFVLQQCGFATAADAMAFAESLTQEVAAA
jgi:hypothetical protein